MLNRHVICQGKTKIIYQGPSQDTYIQYFKDDITAFNNKKHEVLEGKGILNNMISDFIMTGLSLAGVRNHLVKRLNMREQLVQAVSIIPFEVVVRNTVAGSFSKRYGIQEGDPLSQPLIEYFLKDDSLGDPMITDDHISLCGWASAQEIEDIQYLALRVNDFLLGIFYAAGIKLIDFKLEFGRLWDNETHAVILADEISPDTCRLWDMHTDRKLDKDIFRSESNEDLVATYREVAKRMGIKLMDQQSCSSQISEHRSVKLVNQED